MPRPLRQRALLVRAEDGRVEERIHDGPGVLGPIDFGLRMRAEGDFFCIGSGALAGGIVPGSNRLVLAAPSPAWGTFYVSSVGGAALIWDGIGISFLALAGRAPAPSVLVLSGARDRSPAVRLVPVDLEALWRDPHGPGGFYALQRHAFEHLWDGRGTPRVLAVGPAARHTSFGAIGSSKTSNGRITAVDCWAGRGGLGSRLLQAHNVCAIVYGGDFEDEDLTDRAEADGYFRSRFSKSMSLTDLEATVKYRYDPEWKSGGTFGVNFSKLSFWMLAFNYRNVSWPTARRVELWDRLVKRHYLEQFNRETIEPKQFSQCGEPCPAVCKKLNGEFKKDFEPYQAMGPLSGLFDQRQAERLNHRADALGFDGIQVGGQIAWAMECLAEGLVDPGDLGLQAGPGPATPRFEPEGFDAVEDSRRNAEIALAILEASARPGSLLARGMREAARVLGPRARARAVYLANGPAGWMVPNQYWVPGMFAPMPLMGKYFVHYGAEFLPPRELGRRSVERMLAELTTDNAGMCRFHRGWSEKLWPDIVNGHFGFQVDFPAHHASAVRALHGLGQPVCWQSTRIEEILHGYLRNVHETDPADPQVTAWLQRFEQDRPAAARAYWSEIKAGIEEGVEALPRGPGEVPAQA